MKNFLLCLMVVMLLGMPVFAHADDLTYAEAYGVYLYVFHLSYAQGTLSETSTPTISTGTPSEFPAGLWRMAITDTRSRVLFSQQLDPAGLSVSAGELSAPYQNSGTTATFYNASDAVALNIDLSGSRVCDDNGTCDSNAGEDVNTCPGDCGGIAAGSQENGTAAIGSAAGATRTFGALVMQLSFAAAGLILLVGMIRMLDSRTRQ